MDLMVRVVCTGLLIIIVIILLDNVKLLIESNAGKKFQRSVRMEIKKPTITAGNLIKSVSFFLMVNHGPNLCTLEEKIENIPYYKGKNYLAALGECNDKD